MSVPLTKTPAPRAWPAPPATRPTQAPRESALSTPLTVTFVLALTGIGAFLRIWNSAGQSFRLDEGFTVNFAALPLAPLMHGHTVLVKSLFQATAADVHPPGYLLLMHFWMLTFGAGLAALRLPSEIAGSLAIPALFGLAASLYCRRVGLYAAVLGTFSPFWIWHAQEARMYELLLLFTILSTFGFVQALRYGHTWGWVVYFVASLLAVYTQYFAFLILFAQAVFLLVYLRNYTWRQIAIYVGVNLVMAAAYLPWLHMFLTDYHGASDPSLQAPNLYTPLTILSDFLFGYLTVPVTSAVVAAWPLLVPVSLGLGIFARAVPRRAALLWMTFLVPLIVAFAVTFLYRPFISERYLIVCTPGLFILLAVVLAHLPRRSLQLLLIVGTAAVFLLSWHVQETSAANPMVEDYRTVTAYIEAHARPGDVVGLDSYFNSEAYSYNLHDNLPIYDLPLTPRTNGTVPTLTTARLAHYLAGIEAGHKRLWVVYYLESNYDPTNLVRHYLAYHTHASKVIFGGPYQRNQSRYPASYRSVQLVLYQLIWHPDTVEQARPMTTQERRAISNFSPTLRRPFASPFSPPGSVAHMLGQPVAIPHPSPSWNLPVPGGLVAKQHLVIFNPNSQTVPATITQADNAYPVQSVSVPARSELDVRLSGWEPLDETTSLTVRATSPIVPYRRGIRGGTQLVWYGSPNHATSQKGSTS